MSSWSISQPVFCDVQIFLRTPLLLGKCEQIDIIIQYYMFKLMYGIWVGFFTKKETVYCHLEQLLSVINE